METILFFVVALETVTKDEKKKSHQVQHGCIDMVLMGGGMGVFIVKKKQNI